MNFAVTQFDGSGHFVLSPSGKWERLKKSPPLQVLYLLTELPHVPVVVSPAGFLKGRHSSSEQGNSQRSKRLAFHSLNK
jgi:hypothetical protein